LLLVSTTSLEVLNHYAQPTVVSALDRVVGTGMDQTFIGPALTKWLNYSLSSPGVVDSYSSMPGIGGSSLAMLLVVSCWATLGGWACLLLRVRQPAPGQERV